MPSEENFRKVSTWKPPVKSLRLLTFAHTHEVDCPKVWTTDSSSKFAQLNSGPGRNNSAVLHWNLLPGARNSIWIFLDDKLIWLSCDLGRCPHFFWGSKCKLHMEDTWDYNTGFSVQTTEFVIILLFFFWTLCLVLDSVCVKVPGLVLLLYCLFP